MKGALTIIAFLALVGMAGDAPLCGSAYAAPCCKICTKGKACGNTCIPRDHVCHQPPGCACNG